MLTSSRGHGTLLRRACVAILGTFRTNSENCPSDGRRDQRLGLRGAVRDRFVAVEGLDRVRGRISWECIHPHANSAELIDRFHRPTHLRRIGVPRDFG